MITLSELKQFAQLYPSSSPEFIYAFAGGSAVQCWLWDTGSDRIHHDIDLFVFSPGQLKRMLDVPLDLHSFFSAGLTSDGRLVSSQAAPAQLHVVWGGYYDAEITPLISDARQVVIDGVSLLVLSPEFSVISKLSYPNVHRLRDHQDVLALSQAGLLQNQNYLSCLLAKTSLGRFIEAQNILELRTQENLQNLLVSIHRQIISRFLDWDYVHVETLNLLQSFLLLDMDIQSLSVSAKMLSFIESMLAGGILVKRRLQIARLGLCLLSAGIPSTSSEILKEDAFKTLVYQALEMIHNRPTDWLARNKSVLMTFQQLIYLERTIDGNCDWIWQPKTLIRLMKRILFDDFSRLTVFMLVKSLRSDFVAGRMSVADCLVRLRDTLDDKL